MASSWKILVVDDDPTVHKLITKKLPSEQYHVQSVFDATTAIEEVDRHRPDLVILDLMMPRVSGIEVCKKIKSDPRTKDILVLILSAKESQADRVKGLELGADDYVMKPFSPRELVLRVKSIFRRTKDEPAASLRVGKIQLYPERRQCFVGNSAVALTAKEFDLLHELMRARGNVLTRNMLMDRVWGYHGEATSRTLDTHVRRVREKLGDAGTHLETVRGIGYRIENPANET